MNAFSIYFQRSIILQFLLGIPSGLPLALTASTLTVWLTESGISKAAIGVFAAVALPYAFKFAWAPLLDGITIPVLGKRRGWMAITQLMMVAGMAALALSDPAHTPVFTAFAALFLAFSSASHDIAKDAYRVEILPAELQGAGAASFVLGYRVGNLFATAGALYLATYFGWQATYLIMAAIMLGFLLTLILCKEPEHFQSPITNYQSLPMWLTTYVAMPFAEFFKRPDALIILAFIVLYRMADAFLGIMANPFYIELGFTKIQIAEVVKLYGLMATIAGSLIGGAMVFRLGLIPSLWVGGIAASLSNLAYIWQAHVGAETYALALTISLDNISGGLATAAFVAYMASLTNVRFTATQYALLSSLSAVGRTFLTTPSGLAAETFGWEGFFILSTFIGIPALVLLALLTRKPS